MLHVTFSNISGIHVTACVHLIAGEQHQPHMENLQTELKSLHNVKASTEFQEILQSEKHYKWNIMIYI